ncbi:MAG TPA: universal stress protein [Mycobacteriales bacterium]
MSHNELGVLVGVDGAEKSLRAADWAAADAASAGDNVTVSYVSGVSSLVDVPLPERLRTDAPGFEWNVVERGSEKLVLGSVGAETPLRYAKCSVAVVH